MTWVAAAIGGSALLGYMGATSAADTQANAAANALGLTREQFDTINKQQAPFRGLAYNTLNTLGSMAPGGQPTYDAAGNVIGTQQGTGYLTQQFGPEDLASNLAPNYAFMKQQGLGATGQTANVGGGGSNMDLARTKFAEDYASGAYQNAFNNFQTQRGNIYNTLAGIAGLGQAGVNNSSTAAQNFGTNASNLITSGGAAQAGGMMGGANAIGSGLNTYAGMNYISGLMRPQSTAPSNANLERLWSTEG